MGQTEAVTDFAGLLALQHLDTAIDQARYRRSHLPEQVRHDETSKAMTLAESELGRCEQETAENESEQERLESEIATMVSREKEIDKRMKVVSALKEVQALEHEQTRLIEKRTALEDRELEIMETLEQLGPQLIQLNETAHAARHAAESSTVAMAEAQVTIDEQLRALIAQRDDAAAAFPPELLTTYDSMRKRLGGIAVASLDHGYCSGCRLQLPAKELDTLRHQVDGAMVNCEQCGRILVP